MAGVCEPDRCLRGEVTAARAACLLDGLLTDCLRRDEAVEGCSVTWKAAAVKTPAFASVCDLVSILRGPPVRLEYIVISRQWETTLHRQTRDDQFERKEGETRES